jgi:hypothetical protein
LNPHLHLVALDGAYHEQAAELAWQALGHLKISEVGEVLERAVRRMEKPLPRRGLLVDESGAEGAEDDADPSNLAGSAVWGPPRPRTAGARARRSAARPGRD